MGWLLLAVLAGLWSGLLLPLLWRSLETKQKQAVGEAAEQAQEQLLAEWLYGSRNEG